MGTEDDHVRGLGGVYTRSTIPAAANTRDFLARRPRATTSAWAGFALDSYSIYLPNTALLPAMIYFQASLGPARSSLFVGMTFSNNPNHRDDWVDSFYLQSTSQIDGLRHIRHPSYGFYGGVADERVDVGQPDLGTTALLRQSAHLVRHPPSLLPPTCRVDVLCDAQPRLDSE